MSFFKKVFGRTESEKSASPEPTSAPPAPQQKVNKGEVRKETRDLLAGMGSSAGPAREASLSKLIGIGAPAVQLLIDALKDPDRKIRVSAAEALGKMNDNRALSPLGHAGNDPDGEVSAAAKAALKELRRNQEARRLEEMKTKRAQEAEKMIRNIKSEKTWRLQFDHLLAADDPTVHDRESAKFREEELAARGAVTVPAGQKDAGTIGAGWKDLFERASYYDPYELLHSAEGLVKHLPAEEAARLIAARFDIVKLSEDAVHALALNLAKTGLDEYRPMVQQWAENTAFRKKHVAPAIAAYLYGDVRPWAEELEKNKDYAALAGVFNSQDYSIAFQGVAREEMAWEILMKAGQEAVPAITEAADLGDVGIYKLAKLLLKLEAREAVPVLKKHLDQGRFAPDHQLNEEIFKFVNGNRPLGLMVSSVLAGEGSEVERKERIDGILRSAGWLSRDSRVLYCECGYPTRIRYGDGSVGPINPVLDSHSPELYVTEFSCPGCKRHVATVTS